MKRKWFNPSLYIDALLQLRVVGVTYLIIIEISALLTCISAYLGSIRLADLNVSREITYTLLKANPVYLFIVTIFSPIMSLIIFNFLNKRNASDVFHALPDRRTSLFLSLFAAVMSWIAVGILLSTTTTIIGFVFFMPQTVTFEFSSVWALFYALGSGLFTAGLTALAMSLTGTLFSNFAVAGLIALAPRLFIMVFITSLCSLLPILPSDAIPFWLQERNNPIFFLFENLFSTQANVSPFQTIYAFIIGVLYIAAALIIFCRRKSETADKSAPNRILQTAFRLIFTMLICLIPCTAILNTVSYSTEFPGAETIFGFVVLYIIALIGYFVYELITTRRARNLLRAVPALGILVLLNVLFIGGALTIRELTLRDTPDAEDIASVRFLNLNAVSYNKFFNDGIEKIEFKDREINRIISTALQDAAKKLRYGNKNITKDALFIVNIELDGRSMTRRLSLSYEEFSGLFNQLLKNDDFLKFYKILPEFDEVNISISRNTRLQLSDADLKSLYTTFKAEVETLDFKTWFDYINNNSFSGDRLHQSDYIYLPDELTLIDKKDGYIRNIPLSSLLPNTSSQYMKFSNHIIEDSVITDMRNSQSEYGFEINGFGFVDEFGTSKAVFIFVSPGFRPQPEQDFLNDLADLFERKRGLPVDINKPFWAVREKNTGRYFYFNSDSSALPANLPKGHKYYEPQTVYYSTTTVAHTAYT